uniref:RNase H type-1 domain-containing protein n=1 Tax=Setaria italica TaxID=4555 RepID=K4A112_SETIT
MANVEGRLDAIEAANRHQHSSKAILTKRSSIRWVPPEAGWGQDKRGRLLRGRVRRGHDRGGDPRRARRGDPVGDAGAPIPAVLEELPARSSKEEARLAACRRGLALALEHAQATRAIMESDSAVCIDALTRTCRDPSRLLAINREIMELKGRIRGAQMIN